VGLSMLRLGQAVILTGLAFAAGATETGVLVRHNCGGCHTNPADPQGDLTRIEGQRKTPEGWEMTLRRMQMLHHVPFHDPGGTADADQVLARLIKHFSDTQGLAPAETAHYRYILERRLDTIEVPEDAEYAVMCARCHSAARVGLQRRNEDEWRHLVHFHLAQFPTTEYQAGGRDRDWLGTALGRIVQKLASEYPLRTPQWSDWQQAPKTSLAGRWRLAGRMPGKGDFEGVMSARPGDNDRYAVELDARWSDGSTVSGRGNAIVYTGFEWRANIEIEGVNYLQVLAASADGGTLGGRMFPADHVERGVDVAARREDGMPTLLAVQPSQLRRGETATLTLVGSALQGEPGLGPGIEVLERVFADPDRVVIRVRARDDAPVGARAVNLGAASRDAALTVYQGIDRLEVSPAYAVGRVGGREGSQPEVQARFDAIAWGHGPDGQPRTGDDLRIGPIAARWSVAPWDARAAADDDVRFAGTLDKDSGVFTPAEAGPNPLRRFQTNNAGNLKVIATVGEGEAAVSGEGHLLVTVQRWNNPPIR